MSQNHLVEVNRYPFMHSQLDEIGSNAYAVNYWPLVYVLSDDGKKLAYIGETADTVTRMSTHLKHNEKSQLTVVHLISSDKFNKSATLDIESNLIKYMSADGKYSLLNSNFGLVDHNYYQKKEIYSEIFEAVWDSLRREGVVEHSIEYINNSDLFKYSPYKALSFDQRQGLLHIMYALLNDSIRNLVVEGGAGTGKSILAIFLFKLLQTDNADLNFGEFSTEEPELRQVLQRLKQCYEKPTMALVVPMTSFRNTLKKAFSHISGLSPEMVISPSELSRKSYDIVIVDESHRLRRRVNLGAYFGAFDKACDALGFDKNSCSEVDWVLRQSKKSIFFYDENQSIKPSDVSSTVFANLKSADGTQVQKLLSQFRVRGGNAYVKFVDDLLFQRLDMDAKFQSKSYDLQLFDSIHDFVDALQEKDQKHGLSRMIAGYAWPWISKEDEALFDIEIDNRKLKWNSTNNDWINATNSVTEVGCIHTTQGYDLNYAGIIFGREIGYDHERDELVIHKDLYFDRNGRQSIKDPLMLKQFILNIYKTIMLRGIRGTFVYACDEGLRAYLGKHIPLRKSAKAEVVAIKSIQLRPYVNAVPLFDLQAAAGNFSAAQRVEQKEWCAVPDHIRVNESMFACTVVGESMNRVIPNGALCLFRFERGGTRNGKIVLVEHPDVLDSESGAHYSVKEYQSTKVEVEEGWRHEQILLKPLSDDAAFKPIVLTEDEMLTYKVIGEFVCVIG